ncbi:MAG: DUF971 domain-containing protein [Rhodobiaceae bacterium]|nr:DUF971 domain-containing protein [Rhodobiaceae bacterium]
MNTQDRPWPVELRLRSGGQSLNVSFDDGTNAVLEAEYLRVESPSAEVQGHGAGQKKLVVGKESVIIQKLEPVGNYAIRISFNDGHDSGLFTWDYLYELAEDKNIRWTEYLARVAEANLSR